GTGRAKGAGADEWVWAPDGDGYRLAGLGERGHLAQLKGLTMIEKLVRSPGQPIPMALLVGGTAEQMGKDKRSKQPAMDAEALRDAYNRCSVLRAELEQAESEGCTLEGQELRDELDALLQQIRSAVGIRGKVRDLNGLANKLRPSIQA